MFHAITSPMHNRRAAVNSTKVSPLVCPRRSARWSAATAATAAGVNVPSAPVGELHANLPRRRCSYSSSISVAVVGGAVGVGALRPATEARPYLLVRDVQREQVNVECSVLEPEAQVDALLRRDVTRVGGIRATAASDGCIAVLPPIVDARIDRR